MSLIAELKRRNVFRVGVAYAIVAWLLVEVASVVLPALHLPDWALTLLVVLIVAGFPLALILAWAFELTPEGIKRDSDVDPDEAVTRTKGRKLDFAIIGLLAIAVVFLVVDNYILEADPVSTAEAVEREKSIAVLPFVNMSSDPEQDYFSDGISEEILNELAQLPGLRVASRTSAFTFRGENRNMGEIAAKLNVVYVLEGSVRKAGNRIRIAAQLIDARNEKHLWSETYERDLVNVFEIQSEIARAVARKVEIELSPEQEAQLASIQTVKPEAHEAYLRGRYEAEKFTEEGAANAVEHYREALAADPAYAAAYASLAHAYIDLGQPLGGMPYREAMLAARSAALKAIELDASLPAAYAALGAVSWLYDWDWETAGQMFKRAIELNPNSASNRSIYGLFLSSMGRHEEGIAQGTRAVDLDPSSLGMRVMRAEQYYVARDFERSIAECKRLIDINPTYQRAYSVASWSYVVLGNYEQAIEADRVSGDLTAEETASLRAAYTNLGNDGYWHWYLGLYEAQPNISHSSIAWAHAQLGNVDAAFASLDEAFELREGTLTLLREEPFFDSIRGDPRFSELLRRMNFPDR